MSQSKFDLAEHLIFNKHEVIQAILPEVKDCLLMEDWYAFHGLGEMFTVAIEDFVVYKIGWALIDATGKPYEEVSSIVDKAFVVDLFSEDFVSPKYWKEM